MNLLNHAAADPVANPIMLVNQATRPSQLIRSVPERCYREMHRAEPIRPAKLFHFQALTQPIADVSQSLLRLVRRPAGEVILIRNCDQQNDESHGKC